MAIAINQTMTLLSSLLEKKVIVSEIPTDKIAEINKFIKKGAKERRVEWSNAIALTDWAFKQARVQLPPLDVPAAWKQYEAAIEYSVKALSDARGINGSWRTSYTESLEGTQYKVIVEHEETSRDYSFEAASMDDALQEVEKILGKDYPLHITKKSDALCEGTFTYKKIVDLKTKFTVEKVV